MIKAIAIDDEPLALNVIKSLNGNLNLIDLKELLLKGLEPFVI